MLDLTDGGRQGVGGGGVPRWRAARGLRWFSRYAMRAIRCKNLVGSYVLMGDDPCQRGSRAD
jgi:hypothetical protein